MNNPKRYSHTNRGMYENPEGSFITFVDYEHMKRHLTGRNTLEVKTEGYLQNEQEKKLAFEREDAMRVQRDQLQEKYNNECHSHDLTIQLRTKDILEREIYKKDSERLNWLDKFCAFVADSQFNIGPFKIGQLRKMADAGIAQTCPGCDGRGEIGGWVGQTASGGYETERCEECRGTGVK